MGNNKAWLQIKLTLKDVNPPVWRRFQVLGDISLYKLHKVLQALMGWGNYHLYEFNINDIKFGTPDDDSPPDLIDSKRAKLNIFVDKEDFKFKYLYDFGDGWIHELIVENSLMVQTETQKAICLDGERATPPEDSGGPWGYQDYLDLLKTPACKNEDEEKKSRRVWIGKDWDAEYFDLDEVNRRLKSIR